jgi:glycosyltransferase involved in cell wall biosynthesis
MVAAGAQVVQRGTRVLNNDVTAFIAPTHFCRELFPSSLIPHHKIVIKPHFLSADPGQRKGDGSYAVFVGRLSEEKGVRMLIRTWGELPHIPLTVVGNGPLETEVAELVSRNGLQSVSVAGYQPAAEALQLLKGARFVVIPSTCYEVFPRVIVEAFACGVPVVVPSHGAFPELVAEGRTGLWFEPGDEADLARKVRWAWDHSDEMARMGENARTEFEEKYTAEVNYHALMKIYRQAIDEMARVS